MCSCHAALHDGDSDMISVSSLVESLLSFISFITGVCTDSGFSLIVSLFPSHARYVDRVCEEEGHQEGEEHFISLINSSSVL